MTSMIENRGAAVAGPTLEHPEFPSPYHAGERALQRSAGVTEEADRRGRKMLTPRLAASQQSFFSTAPFVVTSTTDDRGQPWAGLVTGEPGFLELEEDGVSLDLNWEKATNNTLVEGESGDKVGLLATEFESRRRNRLNATLRHSEEGSWTLVSDQGYGNCPKYITPRAWNAALFEKRRRLQTDTELSDTDRALIRRSDTFFIASSSGPQQEDANTMSAAWGSDISHRGGEAGFLQLDGDTLVFEDYPGNNMFNTLGNLQQYPFCGILLMDFDNGELLQLAGRAAVELTVSGRQTRITVTSIRRWLVARGS